MSTLTVYFADHFHHYATKKFRIAAPKKYPTPIIGRVFISLNKEKNRILC